MDIKVRQCGAVSVVKPMGAIKGTDADEFEGRLFEIVQENLGKVIIDASAVPMIDSKGLGSMVSVSQELAQSGMTLKLCAVSETMRQVIELTGLSSIFELFDDVNSAVRSYL